MHHIVMLLTNPFRPDPRVLKEALSLSELGYQVTILCWDRQSELPAEEAVNSLVHVMRLQNAPSGYGIGARQLLNLPRFWISVYVHLSKCKPDLIHCHDFDTLPVGLLWGKIHRTPVVYDSHEYYADLVNQRLKGVLGKFLYHMIKYSERVLARCANAIVTVDRNLAGNYKKINRNIVIIGHFPPRKFAEKDHQIFNRPSLTLLYAGRLSTDRGLLIYLELLRALVKRNIPVQLVLAGVFTPVHEEEKFKSISAGLEDSIKFKGWISYPMIYDIYHEADIGLSILLPERRYVAALPVKLFEYMAAGIPVIASNFPEISSIISSENCGVVVNPQVPIEEIAHLIHQWWKNPSIPKSLGENGRMAVLNKYNWEAQINDLSSLYRKLLI